MCMLSTLVTCFQINYSRFKFLHGQSRHKCHATLLSHKIAHVLCGDWRLNVFVSTLCFLYKINLHSVYDLSLNEGEERSIDSLT